MYVKPAQKYCIHTHKKKTKITSENKAKVTCEES